MSTAPDAVRINAVPQDAHVALVLHDRRCDARLLLTAAAQWYLVTRWYQGHEQVLNESYTHPTNHRMSIFNYYFRVNSWIVIMMYHGLTSTRAKQTNAVVISIGDRHFTYTARFWVKYWCGVVQRKEFQKFPYQASHSTTCVVNACLTFVGHLGNLACTQANNDLTI